MTMSRERHHDIDLKLFHRFDPEGVREGFAQLGHEGVDVLTAGEGERERLWSPSRIDGDALRLCQRVAKERGLLFELAFDDELSASGDPGNIRGGWHACFKRRAGALNQSQCRSHAWCESPALACSYALIDLPTLSGAPWV